MGKAAQNGEESQISCSFCVHSFRYRFEIKNKIEGTPTLKLAKICQKI